MGQYQNLGPNQPRNLADHNILITSKEEILLQTRNHLYGLPPDSTPTTSEATLVIVGQPLMIPCPNTEPNPRIPRMTLQPNVHNPHSREIHNYNLVDDLVQCPATMYLLEVLQTFPSQCKSFLSTLGAVDPADT
jgi:hypothetical protein